MCHTRSVKPSRTTDANLDYMFVENAPLRLPLRPPWVTILKNSSPDWVKYNERDNFGELSDKSEFMKVMEEFDANVKIN